MNEAYNFRLYIFIICDLYFETKRMFKIRELHMENVEVSTFVVINNTISKDFLKGLLFSSSFKSPSPFVNVLMAQMHCPINVVNIGLVGVSIYTASN